MDSFLAVQNLSRTLTLSSGIFAGMNLGLSLAVVPAILDSNDPLPVIKGVYKGGSKIAISCLLVSTAAGLTCYMKSGMRANDFGFLLASGLSLFIIPYTGFVMMPINKRLFSMRPDEELKVVKGTVKKWAECHWVRTLVGLSVFVIQVFKIGQ